MEQAVENDTLTDNNEGEVAQDAAPESLLSGAGELGDNEYWLLEGYKAEGERPEWFKAEKYKTVADQAKAYVELEKRFGSFSGAPKDGYDAPEGVEADDYLFQQLAEFGKETNMSPEAFGKAWELLLQQNEAAESAKQEQEMEALGPDAGKRIQQVDRYLRNNLDADQYDEVKYFVTSAKDIQLVEALINATRPQKLPIDGAVKPGGLTFADIEKEMYKTDSNGNLLRSVDINHEKKIQKMLRDFGGDRPHQQVFG